MPISIFASEKQDVLILHSYHPKYAWTADIQKGYEASLYKNFPDANYHIEYMDTKQLFTPEYLRALTQLYKQKYNDTTIDVILSSDDNALNFLLENRTTLFPNVPIVFCGVNYFNPQKIEGHTNITGVNEEAGVEESINLALSLHPYTKNILVINDNTTTGKIIHKKLLQYFETHQGGYNVQYLNTATPDEMLKTIEKYDASDTILFYTLFFRDRHGKQYEVGDVISRLQKETAIPIYGTWSFSLDHGIIGGYLTDGKQQGIQAGTLATQILNGTDVNAIPVIEDTPKKYMFDWNYFHMYGLEESDVPSESTFINKPASFYEVHRSVIHSFGITVLLLFLIILALVLFILKRKQKVSLLNTFNKKLTQEVEERTAELKNEMEARKKEHEALLEKNEELEKFSKIVVGREEKMIELKEKIKELTSRLQK